jgi:hypothetical protein
MTPSIKKLSGSQVTRYTGTGSYREIFTTDIIPPPPTVDRARVFQFAGGLESVREDFLRYSYEDQFLKTQTVRKTAMSKSEWLEDFYKTCGRPFEFEARILKNEKDGFLIHYAEAKNPLFPRRSMSFFLIARTSVTDSANIGFKYCAGTMMDGTLDLGSDLKRYNGPPELLGKLTAQGFSAIKSKVLELEIQEGVTKKFTPIPDLEEFLARFNFKKRTAIGQIFQGPIGQTGLVKDIYNGQGIKITVGFDANKPDERVWVLEGDTF